MQALGGLGAWATIHFARINNVNNRHNKSNN